MTIASMNVLHLTVLTLRFNQLPRANSCSMTKYDSVTCIFFYSTENGRYAFCDALISLFLYLLKGSLTYFSPMFHCICAYDAYKVFLVRYNAVAWVLLGLCTILKTLF